MSQTYDIIVIGAGHAGCEAAYAAARLNKKVLIVSLHKAHIGRLSCNPAIGGLAKGNLVREIDALGGIMAKITDRSSIQFRQPALNIGNFLVKIDSLGLICRP